MFGKSIEQIGCIKEQLKSRFQMKDLGNVNSFLGIEFEFDEDNRIIKLHQSKYIKSILTRYNMDDCNPTATPCDPSTKLTKYSTDNELNENVPYSSAVGALIYLSTCTRPDISLAVGLVGQFMVEPSKTHWTAVKRIYRYLKGTINLSLTFKNNEDLILKGYSDADFASSTNDRRSTIVLQLVN